MLENLSRVAKWPVCAALICVAVFGVRDVTKAMDIAVVAVGQSIIDDVPAGNTDAPGHDCEFIDLGKPDVPMASNYYSYCSYSQNSYSQNSYTQNSYTQNSYTQNSYTQNSYTQNASLTNAVAGDTRVSATAADDFDDLSREVLRLTNIEREKRGLASLSGTNGKLKAVADIRASEILDLFSHTRPNGTKTFTAFAEADLKYSRAAENIAYGYKTPEDAVEGWMNSKKHRDIILDDKLRQLSVGVRMDENGDMYWAQEFCTERKD